NAGNDDAARPTRTARAAAPGDIPNNRSRSAPVRRCRRPGTPARSAATTAEEITKSNRFRADTAAANTPNKTSSSTT
ncbi:hypothetical protein, partial [Mycobacterium sp. VKM Ac-1816D]|uniref:hypothetical protein n=1 Tax=Mycobacterium sp. VKM Ac-1816D TaxID=1273686 RepID=UPI00178C30AC